MGSGGTEWDSNDTFDTIRLNQKTLFVGTGEQITNLVPTPQAGQMAYCTEADSTFTKEKFAVGENTGTSWVMPDVDETSEANLGTASSSATTGVGKRHYRFVTLPSTEKFYILTAFETLSRAVSGQVVMGADIVDASTPTIDSTTLVAISREHTTTGILNTVERVDEVSSRAIRGGTLLGLWVTASAANVDAGELSDTNVWTKVTGHDSTPKFADVTAWAYQPAGIKPAIKVYYRGYS